MKACANRKAIKPLNKEAVAAANEAQPSCSNYAERKTWMDAYIGAGGDWECSDPAGRKPDQVTVRCMEPGCLTVITDFTVFELTEKSEANVEGITG